MLSRPLASSVVTPLQLSVAKALISRGILEKSIVRTKVETHGVTLRLVECAYANVDDTSFPESLLTPVPGRILKLAM